MGWKFSSTNPWRFGSTNYIAEVAGSFSITSAPTEIRRGGSFSLVCVDVTEAPSAATFDGQPLTVDAWDSTSIDLTNPSDTLAGHGAGKILSLTVAGVTRTLSLPHNPNTDQAYTALGATFDPGETNVFEGMTDLDTGLPMTPEPGGQVIYDAFADTYPVLFQSDGSVEIDTDGVVLTGTETFVFRYLLPGVAISNAVTITAADYVGEPVAPSMPSSVSVSIAEGNTALPEFTPATGTGPITYSLGGADAALFTINASTGQPAFLVAPDYDAPSDNGGNNIYNFNRVATNSVDSATQAVTVTVTNVIDNVTPNAFSFAEQEDAEPGEEYQAIAFLTGFEAGATLTAEVLELSNNGVNWSSSITGSPGVSRARATVTASSTFGGEATQTGSVNGVEATFTVTTREADITPNSFGWAPVFNATVDTVIESATKVLSGTEAGVAISVVNGEYRFDDGSGFSAYTSDPGTIPPGATFQVRHTSAAEEGAQVSTQLTIGTFTANFVSYTGAANSGDGGFGAGIQPLITRLIA